MSTIHDLTNDGARIPAHAHRETLDSYIHRVFRAGVLEGAAWGLAQVNPLDPVISPEQVLVPEEDLSESETSDEGADVESENPDEQDEGFEGDVYPLGGPQ